MRRKEERREDKKKIIRGMSKVSKQKKLRWKEGGKPRKEGKEIKEERRKEGRKEGKKIRET